MTHEVAKALALSLEPMYRDRIVTVLGGLVKTASTKTMEGKESRFPIPFGQHSQPIQFENISFIPDQSQRAIVYFEGNDSMIQESSQIKSKLLSKVRLICWYNIEKFQVAAGHSIGAVLVAKILGLLPDASKMSNDILGMKITPGNVLDSTPRLFNQYSYKEEHTQYLLPPYYAFGIDIDVTYQLNHNCHAELTPVDSAGCC